MRRQNLFLWTNIILSFFLHFELKKYGRRIRSFKENEENIYKQFFLNLLGFECLAMKRFAKNAINEIFSFVMIECL